MAFRVLFPPQFQQKTRHPGQDHPRMMDLRVATRAKRDHQRQHGLSRHPMMNDDRAFPSA